MWVAGEFMKMRSLLGRLPFNLDHPMYHLVMNLGIKKSYKNQVHTFPELASNLFPVQENERYRETAFSLGTLRITDLIPGNYTHDYERL
jgi:hypothetical protein